mmetsp:Transcript_99030/g.251398  ORF Transcript_99030/g.251398 Transcript_99030/m.251398 type:complete len:290 (+) Transcript_99030:592-1461(+)
MASLLTAAMVAAAALTFEESSFAALSLSRLSALAPLSFGFMPSTNCCARLPAAARSEGERLSAGSASLLAAGSGLLARLFFGLASLASPRRRRSPPRSLPRTPPPRGLRPPRALRLRLRTVRRWCRRPPRPEGDRLFLRAARRLGSRLTGLRSRSRSPPRSPLLSRSPRPPRSRSPPRSSRSRSRSRTSRPPAPRSPRSPRAGGDGVRSGLFFSSTPAARAFRRCLPPSGAGSSRRFPRSPFSASRRGGGSGEGEPARRLPSSASSSLITSFASLSSTFRRLRVVRTPS